jgi:hypothetical protein
VRAVAADPLPLYRTWLRRQPILSAASREALWLDRPDHPDQVTLDRLRREADTSGPRAASTFSPTARLLDSVLQAGAGVEFTVGRIAVALEQAERSPVVAGEFPRSVGEHPVIVGVPESIYFDYPVLLTWLRAVAERINRRGRRGADPRSGLLTWIGDLQLREDVERAFDAFRAVVGDERTLANHALHAAGLPPLMTWAAVPQPDRTIRLSIPDSTTESIDVFEQLTFEQGRDLRTFMSEALAATNELMNAIIDAFERAAARIAA